ncbi:CsgG/HfaB family protein [Lentisphaerota bacterium ZTH]|nr:hypothetical protein JYG24_04840 [Lentisphaerota bacterium]WET07168.1 CsgG/HfaB family protein [Lentisphaerota bacterium ZTH]
MKKLIVIIATVTLAAVFAQAADRPKIAVLPFATQSTTVFKIQGNSGKSLSVTRSVILRDLSNRLINFLVNSKKFDVLDREYIDRVIQENKLTESEWAKSGQEKRIGKLLVSDYLVAGTVNRLDYYVKRDHLQLTGEDIVRAVAKITVEYRIIKVKTGRIVFSGIEENKLTSDDIRKKISPKERRDWTFKDFKNCLFENTINDIGRAILGSIFPLKIAALANRGDMVIVNRGLGSGIEKGQVYEVFRLGANLIDPDTKEFLGKQEKSVGEIQITSVTPKFSKAKLLKASGEFKIGYVCRLSDKSVKTAETPDYPESTAGGW